jgi:hypothetical protein
MEFTTKPAPEPEEDYVHPPYGIPGNIIFEVIEYHADNGLSIGESWADGCIQWEVEGLGIKGVLEEMGVDHKEYRDGVYVVMDANAFYHKGTWGFDDDDVTYECKGIRPAFQSERVALGVA